MVKRAMNEQDTAQYLDMSVSWLRQSRMNGNRKNHTLAPPYVKLGRSVRYLVADLDRWLEANRVELGVICE